MKLVLTKISKKTIRTKENNHDCMIVDSQGEREVDVRG